MAPSRAAGPKDFLLFEKWMELTLWLMARTQRFPKTLRHSLATRMENLAIGALEDLTTAGYTRDKTPALRRADDKLNRLRVLVRLAHESQALSHGQYEEAVKQMAEAGRLLGGLRRSRSSHDERPSEPPAAL